MNKMCRLKMGPHGELEQGTEPLTPETLVSLGLRCFVCSAQGTSSSLGVAVSMCESNGLVVHGLVPSQSSRSLQMLAIETPDDWKLFQLAAEGDSDVVTLRNNNGELLLLVFGTSDLSLSLEFHDETRVWDYQIRESDGAITASRSEAFEAGPESHIQVLHDHQDGVHAGAEHTSFFPVLEG